MTINRVIFDENEEYPISVFQGEPFMSRRIDMNIVNMSNMIASSIMFEKHLMYEEGII